jgi:hypothetical protein
LVYLDYPRVQLSKAYHADHVRSEERLDGAWFGAGHALKEKAWTEASALVA